MNTKAFMEKDNEISSKYLEQAEKNAINKEEIADKDKWAYFRLYLYIIVFIILNYCASSCSFEIGAFKFHGLRDWSSSLSLLALEIIFLFIYGARANIPHLSIILDRLASIRK